MAELTQEQVERAAPVFYAEFSGGVFGTDARARTIDGLRAAAPFLQFPWDEPTHEEFSAIHNSSICLYGDGKLCRAVSDALRQFILIRNAALMPKPVDPRRKKIEMVLSLYRMQIDNGRTNLDAATDAILAAIDSPQSYSDDHVG